MKKADQSTDKTAVDEIPEHHLRFLEFLAETFVKGVIDGRI